MIQGLLLLGGPGVAVRRPPAAYSSAFFFLSALAFFFATSAKRAAFFSAVYLATRASNSWRAARPALTFFSVSDLSRRRCWSRAGVMSRWILGAFFFFPASRRTTYCRTSSSLVKLKVLRKLAARFGPRRRGLLSSVNPGMS